MNTGGTIDHGTGNVVETGNYSVHGPYVRSDVFTAESGDQIAMDWAAKDGVDAYEIFGFLVSPGDDGYFGNDANDTDGDVYTRVYAQRGDTQDWVRGDGITISTAGTYQFMFVAGSYDLTGGAWLGATLYVDNMKIIRSSVESPEQEQEEVPPTPESYQVLRLALFRG
ncbi:MAG: hypothetical protein BECKG1743E_GA0114224_112103 [Candidatus Kentron sp. G]|nr:MAG: hypothetical protein BECKG1743E_GA0114224_112103 [Candidatus Kentron sp. G]